MRLAVNIVGWRYFFRVKKKATTTKNTPPMSILTSASECSHLSCWRHESFSCNISFNPFSCWPQKLPLPSFIINFSPETCTKFNFLVDSWRIRTWQWWHRCFWLRIWWWWWRRWCSEKQRQRFACERSNDTHSSFRWWLRPWSR